mgnify:CR=1 FL=1
MPLLVDDQDAPVVVSPSFLSGAQDNLEMVHDIDRHEDCILPILIGNRLGDIDDGRDVPRSVADGTAVEAFASTQHTNPGVKRRFFTSECTGCHRWGVTVLPN